MGQKNYLGKYWLDNFKILFKDPSIIIIIKATTKQGGKSHRHMILNCWKSKSNIT